MDSATTVQLVFRGEVLQGFHIEDVKRALGERLRIDETGLARLFTAPRTVLKRAVAPAEAERYVSLFERIGARLHVETQAVPAKGPAPLPTIVPPPIDAPAPPPPPRPAPPPIPAAKAPLSVTDTATATTAPAGPEETIVCPNCQERQSKRVLCRGCATDMPRGIAAREEALAEARAARLAERRARLGLPSETPESDAPGLWGLSFQGRLGRLPYWTGNVIAGTVMYLLLVLLLQRPDGGRWVLIGVAGIAWFVLSLRWTALRLHDLNFSGWWCVVLLVPYVGAAASLAISFVPGSIGDNDHGEPPRPGRWRSLLIAFGVFALVAVVTFSSVINSAARMANDDEDDLIPLDSPLSADAAMPDPEPMNLPPTARVAYRGAYLQARPFKAFAASPSGSWGWTGGQASLQRATEAAMQHCESHRRPDHLPCEIVDAAAQ